MYVEAKKPALAADVIPLLVADVFELAGAFRRAGEEIAQTAGQTQARWQLLSVISGGPHTVAQIARRLGYTRQSIQRTADQLADEELVRYDSNPDHKTSLLVEMTEEGQRVYGEITKAARKWHVALGRQVDREKLEVTHGFIRQLCELLGGTPQE